MRRREFIGLLVGAALSWPLAGRAQQVGNARRIGFLLGLTGNDPEGQARIMAFRQGLEAHGWTEGRDIRIDYRFAGGDSERVRSHAAELVASTPDLIVSHSAPVVAALQQATRTIPIVFVVVNDPMGQALVASLAHPGGNITETASPELDDACKDCIEIIFGAGMQDMELHPKRPGRGLLLFHIGIGQIGASRVHEQRDRGCRWDQFVQQLQPLGPYRYVPAGYSSDVAAGPVQACDKPEGDGVKSYVEYDRDRACRHLGRKYPRSPGRHSNDGHSTTNEVIH